MKKTHTITIDLDLSQANSADPQLLCEMLVKKLNPIVGVRNLGNVCYETERPLPSNAAVESMAQYGGHFVQYLYRAIAAADGTNRAWLLRALAQSRPDYMQRYEEMARSRSSRHHYVDGPTQLCEVCQKPVSDANHDPR